MVERLLGGLETSVVAEDHRPREPVVIVALEREGWDAPRFRLWVEQGLILLPAAAAPGAAADEARAAVIRAALERVIEHDAMVVSSINAAEEPRPGVAWLTVATVPESALDDDAVAFALSGFERSAALTDRAAELISGRRFGAAGEATLRVPGLRYLPWVFLPRSPQTASVPRSLQSVPERLGVRAEPVIHTGMSTGGRLTLPGAGQERLFADLVGLHALSASRDALSAFLGSDEGVVFRTLHSGTFEYPLRERILHARLGQILASGDGESSAGRMLPDKNSLDSAREKATPAVAPYAAAMCSKMAAAIQKAEIEEARYAFDGPYPHRPRPGFTSLKAPGPDVWQRVLDDGGWAVFDPSRQAKGLSRDVSEALEDCARCDAGPVLEAAMNGARETMRGLLHELETTMQGQLKLGKPPEGASGSRLAHGIGAALAVLGAVRDEAARHEVSVSTQPELVAQCKAIGEQLRGAWEGEEELLLEAGRSVPSRGGVYVEVAGAGLAVVGGILGTIMFVVPPIVIGALGAVAVGLLWRQRNREITRYFEQWEALGQRWLAQANAGNLHIVVRLNEQAHEVKKLAARDLASAVRTTEDRFRLEVRGFIHLVEGQHGVQARRRESEPQPRESERLGRFRYAPEVGAEALDEKQRTAFDGALCQAFAPSLELSGIPERVTIAKYQAVLDQFLVTESDEKRLVEAHRKDATAKFEQALGYGLDAEGRERSDVQQFEQQGLARSVVVVGKRLGDRLAEQWEKVDLLAQIDDRSRPTLFGVAVARREDAAANQVIPHSMTPEVAVILTVRAWKAVGVTRG